MAKVVLIEAKKVSFWDTATPADKTIIGLSDGADLKYDPKDDRLHIEPKRPSFHKGFSVVFSELDNVYGTANLEEFTNHITDNSFFSSASGGSEAVGGVATILSSTTSVIVTHGASFNPSISEVSVIATNSLHNSSKFWISDLSPTQFTINVDVSPSLSLNATFAWSIRRI